MEPNSVARARAAVGPTWRIERATSTRHSGTSLRFAEVGEQARAVGAELGPVLALLRRPGEQVGAQQLVRGRGRRRRPRRRSPLPRAAPGRPPSRAPRCRRPPGRPRGRPARSSWAGHWRVVGAAEVLVALLLLGQRGAARGALGRHHPRLEPLGPQRQHRPDDLGDHVAGLAQHDGVAGADVLALDLVGVVQGGPLDRRARPPWSAPSRRTASPGRCVRC